MYAKNFIIGICSLFLTGCSSMQLNDFKNTKPEFIPEEYFNGKLTAYGIVKNRSGKIIRNFTGDMLGSWDDNGIGTLKEWFVYDDGEKLYREWTLHPTGGNSYTGTADDIVGDANMQKLGNTIMIDYTMRVPYNGSTVDINVKDWLHLQSDGVVLNHSQMKKYGFKVGELVITIIKNFPQK